MSSGGHQLEVSIILPCLNEAQTVAACVRDALAWLRESGTQGEVIVVDNGSWDGSAELAAAAGARTVKEPRRGKGNAVRRGIEEATGQFIVLADADGTYDLRHLNAVVQPLRNGYDMVIGNRLRGAMEPKSMPRLHRWVGNPFFSAAISLVAGRRFGDPLSGLRAFHRAAWNVMAPQAAGFELESEMCLRGGRHRLRVAEVATPYARRQAEAKLRGLAHGWQITRFILLESADVILLVAALLAVTLGGISLVVGALIGGLGEVGSARWQLLFAGSVLLPGGTTLIMVGLVAKWLAWQRGAVAADWPVRVLTSGSAPTLGLLLLGGCLVLMAGLGVDAYLLWAWSADSRPARPLAWSALAQALTVSGINLLATALMLSVLRLRLPSEHDAEPG